MKKFLATILLIVYLTASSGATVHMHYCMGKIYSIDLIKKDDCSKCGMKANEGCCKDEFKVLKVKDNHQLAGNDFNLTPKVAGLFTNYNIDFPVYNDVAHLATNNNSPPRSAGTSLCILNSVFRL